MPKTYYYCGKCESTHQSGSKIGKRHQEHMLEKPAAPPADTVVIDTAKVVSQTCIGVLLTVKPGSNRENAREVLIDYEDKTISDKYGEDGLPADAPYLTIALPCGGSFNYDRDEIPLEDVPCSCGDESHWILKYQDAVIPDFPADPTGEDSDLGLVVEVGPVPPQPPRSAVKCSTCQDEGMIVVGHDADGRAYRSFCGCGQESYDEKIGLLPRRNHNTEAHVPTDEEAQEATHRMTRGGTHEEYIQAD